MLSLLCLLCFFDRLISRCSTNLALPVNSIAKRCATIQVIEGKKHPVECSLAYAMATSNSISLNTPATPATLAAWPPNVGGGEVTAAGARREGGRGANEGTERWDWWTTSPTLSGSLSCGMKQVRITTYRYAAYRIGKS